MDVVTEDVLETFKIQKDTTKRDVPSIQSHRVTPQPILRRPQSVLLQLLHSSQQQALALIRASRVRPRGITSGVQSQ